MPAGDNEYGPRLKTLEGEVQGIRNGQQALRDHVDDRFDQLKDLITDGQREPPMSSLSWAILMLALSSVVIALVVAIFTADYYFF